MRLNPVVDLVRDFVLKRFAFHHLLVHEHLLNEDLCEALLELVVCVPDRRSVLTVVDLGAAHRSTVLARGLITVSLVQSEHKLVGDFVKEWDVGSELSIT